LLSESTFALVALPLGLLFTVMLTFVLMRVGRRKGVVDIPNERSSHTSPVPRGGGLAVIIVFFVFLFVYQSVITNPLDNSVWKSLLFGGAIIAAIGFVDDLRHIPACWRFLAHSFAAVLS